MNRKVILVALLLAIFMATGCATRNYGGFLGSPSERLLYGNMQYTCPGSVYLPGVQACASHLTFLGSRYAGYYGGGAFQPVFDKRTGKAILWSAIGAAAGYAITGNSRGFWGGAAVGAVTSIVAENRKRDGQLKSGSVQFRISNPNPYPVAVYDGEPSDKSLVGIMAPEEGELIVGLPKNSGYVAVAQQPQRMGMIKQVLMDLSTEPGGWVARPWPD